MTKLQKIKVLVFYILIGFTSQAAPKFSVNNGIIIESQLGIVLKADHDEQYSWFSLDPKSINLQCGRARNITAEIMNTGSCEVEVLLWAVGANGWNSSAGKVTIASGESATAVCDLRAQFTDGTPKLDPNNISHIEIMIIKPKDGAEITVRKLQCEGDEPEFVVNKDRVFIPELSEEKPVAGLRVKYSIAGKGDLYGVLYLPEDWEKGKSYPMIVEFPGNIFYTANCYSTGLPDQCAIGYGISKGKDVILLSLPFVDYSTNSVETNGWGDPDDTVDYTIKMVEEICQRYGADKDRIMLTGFSRGAIACGFIGLRTPEIASLWSAIHCCQHFDGDGWKGAKYEDAELRLLNGLDIPQFHTDNVRENLKTMMSEAGVNATYVKSKLGAHACDMFLDDRASTEELRRWFWSVVGE